jgi:hypothetical protein
MKPNWIQQSATLALMSAAARAGDSAGCWFLGAEYRRFAAQARRRTPGRGAQACTQAVEPEMIEPAIHARFEFISANSQRRSLVVVITIWSMKGSRVLTSLKLNFVRVICRWSSP